MPYLRVALGRGDLYKQSLLISNSYKFNGKGGAPAYIAFEGKVYDVSGSFLWQRGRHQVRHLAGIDYTGGLEEAPHAADLLERFPVVGIVSKRARYRITQFAALNQMW
jgi:predicted heme/steroid binding protein